MDLLTCVILMVSLLCLTQSGFSSTSRFDLMKPLNDVVFNVVTDGAVGDSKTDDSQAFLKAWSKMCGATGGTPTLLIPSGKTFLLNPVTFKGPCKSPNVHVQVLGNIVAPNQSSAWSSSTIGSWILVDQVNGLTIDGSGQIDGQGSIWWRTRCVNECGRPTALKLNGCNGVKLSGLKHLNSQRNHISIDSCNNVIVSNIHISAPQESPNTDGIDIKVSTQIQIKDSFIGTGDDCIAINGGSSFINITNVACGPGHGISVGSLGANKARDTVEEIHVKNCSFTGTKNGPRIKTFQGGSGYARKISFEDITLVAVEHPIVIDQFYCNGQTNCTGQTSAVKISDVTFSRIHGTTTNNVAINLSCSQTVSCEDIKMDQINITSAKGSKVISICSNAHGRSTTTSPVVPCLS